MQKNRILFTENLEINFIDLYKKDDTEACHLLQDYEDYKNNITEIHIKKLIEEEIKMKNKNTYIRDELIKNHFIILEENNHSIYNFFRFNIILKNLPENLLCKKIKNFYAHYHSQNKITCRKNKIYSEKNFHEKNLIILNGNIKFDKKSPFLTKYVYLCKNIDCHSPYEFYIINNKIYIFYKYLFFHILEIKKFCFFCKKPLSEKFEERLLLHYFYYTVFSNSHFFPVKSSHQINLKNIFLGYLKRIGKKMIFISIPFIPNKPKPVNENLPIKINSIYDLNINLINFSYFFLRDLKEKITGNDILLILIFHLFFLSNFSIAIFSNDSYYIFKIAKHFFYRNKNICITERFIKNKIMPEKLLFISNKLKYLHDKKMHEQFNLHFYLKFTDCLNISYENNMHSKNIYAFKINNFNCIKITSLFEEYSQKIFEKYGNSNKSLILLKAFSTVLKNIYEVEDEIILEYIYKIVINCLL